MGSSLMICLVSTVWKEEGPMRSRLGCGLSVDIFMIVLDCCSDTSSNAENRGACYLRCVDCP
jgi:hypothetical protein